MFFCYRCGAEHIDEAVVCTKCGCKIGKPNSLKSIDDINFGIGCLATICIYIPILGWILGLILYLSWKDSTPNRAKMVGILTLIQFLIYLILMILTFLFYATIFAGLTGLAGYGSWF